MTRLEKLKSLQDPNYARSLGLEKMASVLEGLKGEDGRTPQKGVDYFTPAEIAAWKNFIIQVAQGTAPVKGIDYRDGRDGAPGRPGKDGRTPIRGEHYWTPEDKQIIAKEAAKLVVVKDGVSPKIEDIVPSVARAVKDQLHYDTIKGAPDAKSINSLIEFLKRGGFRGGGSGGGSGITAFSQLSDVDVTGLQSGQFVRFNGTKWVPYTLVLPNVPTDVFNELVSGSANTFTLSANPITGTVRLYARGQRLTPGAGKDYLITGTAIVTADTWSAGDILADYQK